MPGPAFRSAGPRGLRRGCPHRRRLNSRGSAGSPEGPARRAPGGCPGSRRGIAPRAAGHCRSSLYSLCRRGHRSGRPASRLRSISSGSPPPLPRTAGCGRRRAGTKVPVRGLRTGPASGSSRDRSSRHRRRSPILCPAAPRPPSERSPRCGAGSRRGAARSA